MNSLKQIVCIVILISGFIIAPFILRATEFSSTNFKVLDPVIQPGAGFSTSTNFQLRNLLGQPAIGISTATSFSVKSGFLYFPELTTLVVATSPVVIVAGGGGGIMFKLPLKIKAIGASDFNFDGKINVIDLSIMLFYYGESGSEIERYDLSGDGTIDFIDFSILFYYWIF